MNDPISFKHFGSPDCEPFHYTACGLDNVYLSSGYKVRDVNGERYVAIHDVEELHAAIAEFLVRQRKVLAGPEVRFLRKYLDLTQRELGTFLGVSDQSVARYEKGQTALEGPTDNLLRLLVLAQSDGDINVREALARIGNADDAVGDRMTLERSDHEWRVAA
jgi:putative zinc finger/helix-turn-helix YgiT family protein